MDMKTEDVQHDAQAGMQLMGARCLFPCLPLLGRGHRRPEQQWCRRVPATPWAPSPGGEQSYMQQSCFLHGLHLQRGRGVTGVQAAACRDRQQWPGTLGWAVVGGWLSQWCGLGCLQAGRSEGWCVSACLVQHSAVSDLWAWGQLWSNLLTFPPRPCSHVLPHGLLESVWTESAPKCLWLPVWACSS